MEDSEENIGAERVKLRALSIYQNWPARPVSQVMDGHYEGIVPPIFQIWTLRK